MTDNAATDQGKPGDALRDALRGLVAPIMMFSMVVNLLMLTGPIFMLQLYERVIASRSEETLVVLLALVAFLYAIMAILDQARARIAARAGGRVQTLLERRVFDAALRHPSCLRGEPPWRELDAIRRFTATPGFPCLLDVPWTPLLLGAIFLFHPLLGAFAVGAALVLALVTIMGQARNAPDMEAALTHARGADRLGNEASAKADELAALGMRGAITTRWLAARDPMLHHEVATAERNAATFATSRTLRLFLQSAVLALGAWLVLQQSLSAGAMIAVSILMGRALAPIDTAILQWGMLRRARAGWGRLTGMLDPAPPHTARTAFATPSGTLEARELTVIPPNARRPTLRMVSLRLEPGMALGVIGGIGAGKTTLARALTGAWPLAGGSVRLDGAERAQHDADSLCARIGYLPQSLALFSGTVAENIARMRPDRDDAAVMRAAARAGAHEMILQFPDGYDTRLDALAPTLSSGQLQRIALARALFGDPMVLILDDPSAMQDGDGCAALNAALRAHKSAGGSALILSHRPNAIAECEHLLLLENGVRKMHGPRERVLRDLGHGPATVPDAAGIGSAS